MSKMYIRNGKDAWTELTEEEQQRAASLNLFLTKLALVGLIIWLLVSW